MFTMLARFCRHAWLDAGDARRIVSPEVAEQLRRRVAASEARHTGEVRICIEGSLPISYLWRHLRHRIPMAQIVRQRAVAMFSRLGVWDTEDNNGVLIYLLLAEHAIELVTDRGVHQLVGEPAWQAMVDRMGSAFQAGRLEDGLTQALEEVSAVLVAHFAQPEEAEALADEAPNQLPDEPVFR